jgi:putative Holliday junction resolvase
LLGIDFGRRRIGLAISDPTGTIAQGIDTVVVTGLRDAVTKVADVIHEYRVDKVILGNPLRLDGSEGPAAMEAREFGERLAAITNIEIIDWDERLTSAAAKRSRQGLPLRKRRQKAGIDRTAAILLLQSYLDFQQRSA